MPYATQQDLIDAFSQEEILELSQLDDSAANTIGTANVEAALDDASDLIDSYIGGRYTLPLSSTPRVLVRICCDIARYMLDRYNPREDVRQRYEDAIRWLEQVAKGVLSLGLDEAGAEPPTAGSPQFLSPGRQFTNETLRGF